jgi:hypothetical protein
MADHDKGRVVKATKRKVADALDEWLIRIEHSIKPSMAENWRNYGTYYVIPYIVSETCGKSTAEYATRCIQSCSPRAA